MSKQILHIQSSIFGDNGVSSGLAEKLVTKLQKQYAASVTYRDVSNGDIPHFDMSTISAIGEGKAELADTLIKEVQDADIIVVAAPMYNFAVPSQLKSWIDHIARAGVTFKYTDTGPVGLLTGKKVYVTGARGGFHKGQPSELDTPYLKTVFGFLGLSDVEFVYAEGVNMGGETRNQSIAAAESQVAEMA